MPSGGCFRFLLFLVMFSGPFLAANGWSEQGDGIPIDDPATLELLSADGLLMQSEMLLSGGGSLIELRRAPYVATIITAEEIAASGALTLSEALEMVPGLHVSVSNYGRMDPIYSIRGIHTRMNTQVAVLVDGHPLTSFSGNRPYGFELPVRNIARIEVIRGPGSAVYGADAFAGVVNVITKDAADLGGTHTGALYGSFDTRTLWLQHGRRWGGTEAALSLEWYKTGGDDGRTISSDVQSVLDEALGTDASRAPGSLATNRELISAQLQAKAGNWSARFWHWQTRKAGLGAGLALALDPDGYESLRINSVDLAYTRDDLLPDWDFTLQGMYRHSEAVSRFILFPPRAVLPIGEDGNIDLVSPAGFTFFPDGVFGFPEGDQNLATADLVAVYSGFRDHRLRLAGGFQYHDITVREVKNFGPRILDGTQPVADSSFLTDITGTDAVFLPDRHRRVWHLSAQDEWLFARGWSLTGGARYDHYSDFGDTFNPRLALVWEVRDDLTTKLLYGRAFRAPSFAELYMVNNPTAVGNPELKPERIDTYELLFNHRPTLNFRTTTSFFFYQARDLIEYVQEDPRTSRAQNARDQEGYGFELEAAWEAASFLGLTGNFACQRSKDSRTGEAVPEAPRYSAWGRAQWHLPGGWEFNNIVTYAGGRPRAAEDGRSRVADHILVDLVLRKQRFLDHADLFLSVKNLFDRRALEPSGAHSLIEDLPLPGRSLYAGVNLHF